jgi:hypothetical protein
VGKGSGEGKMRVLKGAPQSITEISHEKYLCLKSGGGIDERFTLD